MYQESQLLKGHIFIFETSEWLPYRRSILSYRSFDETSFLGLEQQINFW